MIKFLNIYKQDFNIQNKNLNDIKKIIFKNNFILGDEVNEFEKKFSKYTGAKYAVGVANGTDALTIALKILNLPRDSEVIIPAMTYCSTAFAILNAGLTPVLADIEDDTPLISIEKLVKKINKKTKVIMPVHLYGSVVDIIKIKKKIKNKGIIIIDDCSQAHGATFNSLKVGSLADISCFSLYPGKNLGAYGDAGIITTNNIKFYKKIKNFRNLGSDVKFVHNQIGFNSRLDTIQAKILTNKLLNLNRYNRNRKKISKYYDININNSKIEKLRYTHGSVYHQYVIKVKDRNKLIKFLEKNKIQFGIHYPKSINKIDSLKKFFTKKVFNNAENLAKKCLSLPIEPTLSKKEIQYIVKKLNSF